MACASHLHLFRIFADSRNCASSIAWIIYLPPESPKNIHQHTPLNVRISSPRNCWIHCSKLQLFHVSLLFFPFQDHQIENYPSSFLLGWNDFFRSETSMNQKWVSPNFFRFFGDEKTLPKFVSQVTWRARPYPLVVGSCTLAALIGGVRFRWMWFCFNIQTHGPGIYNIGLV